MVAYIHPFHRLLLVATCRASRWALGVLALGLVASLSGCTSLDEYVSNGFKVGPNYQKPPAPVASAWIDSKSKGVNVASPDLDRWWSVFNDSKLNSLIDQAYSQNLDLRTAGTRILAARATRNIAAGNLFPQLQEAFADISRNGLSGSTANPIPDRFFDNSAVGFNLAWEIDFWGRFRRGVESADAELDASIENYDDALVLLLSDVASTYIEIRVFQQRIKYAAENILIQTELVKQAEDRLKGGVGRKIDQGQMRSNLTDTQALKEQLEIGLRLANNRLCILLGVPVRDLLPELGDQPLPPTPPEVIVGIPAELLRRRPDLRRAERLVAAQSARIGIATSNLYPRFSLLGTLGYEAENFSDLFTSKSFIGSIGPNMRWDILNYGRLVNGIRFEDARFQTTVLDYQSAVLRAGREVEDGVVLFLRSQAQVKHLTESAKEAKIAADESVILSKDVKFDLNRAFVTSNFLVTQQDKLAVAEGDIAQGLIQVYRALGGGWEIRRNEQKGDQP
ncbi:MAG: efflux transporter outer membrane subunit [Gemmataceae bacterium]|nr:efflux transporter outer membrane subunit [Gemmataceae bacterium]MCI0739516.1 efflux transporter outer membrane subunit [Gemmataceae bacterium]